MLNGLWKKPAAPSFRACSRVDPTCFPEMKMIGTSMPESWSCRWRSIPLIPGKSTSRIRQDESSRRPEARNSSAELNDATLSPADEISRESIRHIELSSSMTEIKLLTATKTCFHLNPYQDEPRYQAQPRLSIVPKYNTASQRNVADGDYSNTLQPDGGDEWRSQLLGAPG